MARKKKDYSKLRNRQVLKEAISIMLRRNCGKFYCGYFLVKMETKSNSATIRLMRRHRTVGTLEMYVLTGRVYLNVTKGKRKLGRCIISTTITSEVAKRTMKFLRNLDA